MGRTPAKRVNIVRIQMVKEASLLYPARRVRMARDVVELFREFLQETDREQFFMLGRPDRVFPQVRVRKGSGNPLEKFVKNGLVKNDKCSSPDFSFLEENY
jgi:hypothetical protein